MSVQEGVIYPVKPTINDTVLVLTVTLSALILLGPVTLFGGAALCRWLKLPRTRYAYALSAGGIMISVLIFSLSLGALANLYKELYNTLSQITHPSHIVHAFSSYLVVCLVTVPLIPSVAGGLLMFDKTRKVLRPYKTTEEWKEEQLAREAQWQEAQEHVAKAAASSHPTEPTPNELHLGTYIGGESLPRGKRSIGIRQAGRWVIGQVGSGKHDLNIIREHMFVVGATGSGKTTTLLRLCTEVLKNCPELDLVVVDGKGDEKVAQELRALIWKYREYNAPVVRLDLAHAQRRGPRYHGFCGSADSIYNRLAVMVKVNEAADAGQAYYADLNRDILTLICFAPCGPPRSFREVRERLNISWLLEAYKNDYEELLDIKTIDPAQLSELGVKLRPLARMLRNVIGPDGFKLEETRAAIFSLDTLSNKDSAGRFCEFFIEDFKNFVNRRAQRPGFLVIDEFGAFGNENIKDLLAMARSRNWGVALFTQDYANLGDALQARQVVANCTTRFLMNTSYPDEMAMLAGTKLQVEGSIQRGPEGPTGMGSDRLQHALKIDPNAVRMAPRGKAWVYRFGYTVEVQVSPVAVSEEELAAVPPECPPAELEQIGLFDEDKPAREEQAKEKQDAGGEQKETPVREDTPKKRARGTFKLE